MTVPTEPTAPGADAATPSGGPQAGRLVAGGHGERPHRVLDAPFRQTSPQAPRRHIAPRQRVEEAELARRLGLDREQLITAINDGRIVGPLREAGEEAPDLATALFQMISDQDIRTRLAPAGVARMLEVLPPDEEWYMGGKDGPEGERRPRDGFPEGLPFRLSRLLEIPDDYRDWCQDRLERVALRVAADPSFAPLRDGGNPARSWRTLPEAGRRDLMQRTVEIFTQEFQIPTDKLKLSFFSEPRGKDGTVLYGSCNEDTETGMTEVSLNTDGSGPFNTLSNAFDTINHEMTHVFQSHLANSWRQFPPEDPRHEAGRLFAVIPRDSSAVQEAQGHQAYEDQLIERDARAAGADAVGWLRSYGRAPAARLERRLAEVPALPPPEAIRPLPEAAVSSAPVPQPRAIPLPAAMAGGVASEPRATAPAPAPGPALAAPAPGGGGR